MIGINIFSYWLVPATDSPEDLVATQRGNEFYIGWLVTPKKKKKIKFNQLYVFSTRCKEIIVSCPSAVQVSESPGVWRLPGGDEKECRVEDSDDHSSRV